MANAGRKELNAIKTKMLFFILHLFMGYAENAHALLTCDPSIDVFKWGNVPPAIKFYFRRCIRRRGQRIGECHDGSIYFKSDLKPIAVLRKSAHCVMEPRS